MRKSIWAGGIIVSFLFGLLLGWAFPGNVPSIVASSAIVGIACGALCASLEALFREVDKWEK